MNTELYDTGEIPMVGDHISPIGDIPGIPPRMALQVVALRGLGIRICPVYRPSDEISSGGNGDEYCYWRPHVFSFFRRGNLDMNLEVEYAK